MDEFEMLQIFIWVDRRNEKNVCICYFNSILTTYISFLDEPCEHGTQTGVCYGRNDIVPKGLIITDTLCDSTEPECFCFVQEPEPCTGKYQ